MKKELDSAYEKQMLDEIRSYLADSHEIQMNKKPKPAKPSPYASADKKTIEPKSKKKKSDPKNRGKNVSMLSVDEKLDYYTATFKPLQLHKDEVTVKNTVLPFFDTLAVVQESFKRNEESLQFNDYRPLPGLVAETSELKISDMDNSNDILVARMKAEALHNTFGVNPDIFTNRYPRLCAHIKFNQEEMDTTMIRGDVWLVRFMEGPHICKILRYSMLIVCFQSDMFV